MAHFFTQNTKGLLLVVALSVIALVAPLVLGSMFSPLLVAIVLGMLLGNTLYPKWKPIFEQGVGFSQKQILRAGIVLYGFRLTFSDVMGVGIAALLLDVIIVFGTFFLTLWLAQRVFRVDRETAILIGSGASICGAAAVLAAAPVAKAPAHKVSVAVATVVLFGTIAMLVYPLIYAAGVLPFSASEFGIYIGATVHEVAQVVAAGGVISETVANTAVITKMTRVMLLAPFLLMLSFMMGQANTSAKTRISVPWFAVGFVLVVALHSVPIWPKVWVQWVVWLDTLLLCMAMAALGLTTNLSDMVKVGLAPFKLAGVVFLWLVFAGAAMAWVIFGVFNG